MKLSNFEIKLLKFVLTEEKPELLEQIPNLEVKERKYTVVGMYTELQPINGMSRYSEINCSLGRLAYGKNSDFEDIIRFDISVIDGQLDCIEIFCNYTDELPTNLDDFELAYLQVSKSGKH